MMGRRRFLSLMVIGVSYGAALPAAHAQRGGGAASDSQIVEEAQKVATAGRVELYRHGVSIDGTLAELADRALSRMEQLLDRRFDEAALGRSVRIYVAADVGVSHVWRGYDHPRDPRAMVFLNPLVARLALSGRNATYAHELAHLLTWRFRCHTLREGLADWLAMQLHPGSGVGPNPGGLGSVQEVPNEIRAYLGTTRPPPREVTTSRALRPVYYYASYRFVDRLIRLKGLPTFMELYESDDPEAEFDRLYGKPRSALAAEAFE